MYNDYAEEIARNIAGPLANEYVRGGGLYGIAAVAPDTPDALTCGTCGASWAEDITPAGRCPWEYDHYAPDEIDGSYLMPLLAQAARRGYELGYGVGSAQ